MNLLFACGGSGGHIFPALAVAEEITDMLPVATITFVSSGRAVENEIFRNVRDYRVVTLDAQTAAQTRRVPLWHPQFTAKMFSEIGRAAAFIRSEKPDGIVGFGGQGSFPFVAAGRLCGVPVLIHEQNVLPGLANRILSFWSDGVALSFSETRLGGKKASVTGNPIRRMIERECRREALEHFGFTADKQTLLVLGGSQGAESVNTLFLGAAERLPEHSRCSIQVLHLCGKMNPQESERRLSDLGIASRAFSFFDRMDLAYGCADLAVGRAGATFLSEMESCGLPAILIPYPFAGGHQLANARVVALRTGAVIAEQKNLDSPRLAVLIEQALHQKSAAVYRPKPAGVKPARRILAQWIMESVCAS